MTPGLVPNVVRLLREGTANGIHDPVVGPEPTVKKFVTDNLSEVVEILGPPEVP